MKAELDKYVDFMYSIDGNNSCEEYREEFREDIRKGIPLCDKYGFIEIERPIDEQEEIRKIADCSMLWDTVGTYVFSEKAKNCLENLIDDYVEFIPVKYQDKVYYIVNVINFLDGIDYEKSKFRTLKSGSILGVEEFSFVENKIRGNALFKILLEGRIHSTEVFVLQEVKDKVEENGLIGFSFMEVWSRD